MRDDEPPARKLDRLIETLVRSIDESTYFLPIFLREIADGGAHLGPEELGLLAGMFATVSGIIAEGTKQKSFQPVHPALAHFTLIGPLVMFRATGAGARANQEPAAHRDSGCGYRHARPPSADGCEKDAGARAL